MKLFRYSKVLLIIVLFSISSSLFAKVPTWKIIPNQSTLSFTATQNDAPVTGEFKKFDGQIAFDAKALNESRVDITVDMNSLVTSYHELKETLLAADWFNVKLFPTAHFIASQFKATGNQTFTAEGTLTIRDRTVPIHLIFTLSDIKDHLITATGDAQLNRSQFGVGQGEWASTKEIKDAVTVHFVVKAAVE